MTQLLCLPCPSQPSFTFPLLLSQTHLSSVRHPATFASFSACHNKPFLCFERLFLNQLFRAPLQFRLILSLILPSRSLNKTNICYYVAHNSNPTNHSSHFWTLFSCPRPHLQPVLPCEQVRISPSATFLFYALWNIPFYFKPV